MRRMQLIKLTNVARRSFGSVLAAAWVSIFVLGCSRPEPQATEQITRSEPALNYAEETDTNAVDMRYDREYPVMAYSTTAPQDSIARLASAELTLPYHPVRDA